MGRISTCRLALGGTKNSRTAGNIAMVERLFMRALEGEPNQESTGQLRGKQRQLTKGEYYVKLLAFSHVDELAEASLVQRNPDGSRKVEPDKKNHPFAKDGFEYRTVFFQDFDGKYYRVTLSVGLADGISTVYNIGQIKETEAPEGEIISVIGSKARDATVSVTRVPQNSFGVNSKTAEKIHSLVSTV